MRNQADSANSSDSRPRVRFRFTAPAADLLLAAEYFLLFLLFTACSTPYRINPGSVSVGLSEIVAWLYILWRCATGSYGGKEEERNGRWLMRGIGLLAVWAALLWAISPNWITRRGMFTDWLLAGAVLLCLLHSPIKDWKRIALLMVLAALPNAFLGALQYGMGIGLAPKDLSGWSKGAASFPIYGLFRHSNDLAVYLYWPVLLCIGLAASGRNWIRASYAVLAFFFGLILWWTVSRSTLFTLALAGAGLALIFLLRRKKAFAWAMAGGAACAAAGLAGLFLALPLDRINRMISGRLGLWDRTINLIVGDPLLLPMGYLAEPPPTLRVFWIPHNIYLLSWIEYGWPGVVLLAGLAGFFLWGGWKRYERLRSHPGAAALWAGFAGLFLLNGMVSLYFHETYVILNFIAAAAVWIAQMREIDLSTETPSRSAWPPAGE
ncbi:MAG: hypothetical protein JW929_10690 [Anaerolineales bacterium]|nr:hypothetical protein [Anaerolineales bacterium]